MHSDAVRCLDSEQRACEVLRRSKVDCVAMLKCAQAVLFGSSDPVVAEMVMITRMTVEQVRQLPGVCGCERAPAPTSGAGCVVECLASVAGEENCLDAARG